MRTEKLGSASEVTCLANFSLIISYLLLFFFSQKTEKNVLYQGFMKPGWGLYKGAGFIGLGHLRRGHHTHSTLKLVKTTPHLELNV